MTTTTTTTSSSEEETINKLLYLKENFVDFKKLALELNVKTKESQELLLKYFLQRREGINLILLICFKQEQQEKGLMKFEFISGNFLLKKSSEEESLMKSVQNEFKEKKVVSVNVYGLSSSSSSELKEDSIVSLLSFRKEWNENYFSNSFKLQEIPTISVIVENIQKIKVKDDVVVTTKTSAADSLRVKPLATTSTTKKPSTATSKKKKLSKDDIVTIEDSAEEETVKEETKSSKTPQKRKNTRVSDSEEDEDPSPRKNNDTVADSKQIQKVNPVGLNAQNVFGQKISGAGEQTVVKKTRPVEKKRVVNVDGKIVTEVYTEYEEYYEAIGGQQQQQKDGKNKKQEVDAKNKKQKTTGHSKQKSLLSFFQKKK